MAHVWVEIEQLVILPGVIEVRLPRHGDVCQVLLQRKDVPTPGTEDGGFTLPS